MSWLHPSLRDPTLRETYQEVLDLAEWSAWAPFLAGSGRPQGSAARYPEGQVLLHLRPLGMWNR